MSYKRTFEELEKRASKFWPAELSEMEAKLSVIPLLLETQDQFIGILSIATDDIEGLFKIIETSAMPGNLFTKHLVILADFGGEMLERVSNEFSSLFPRGKLAYVWRGQERSYDFRAVQNRRFNNKSLRIDGRELFNKHMLDDLQKDAIALLLFGSANSAIRDDAVDEDDTGAGDVEKALSALSRCEIGDYVGKPDDLSKFIKQRYIWVSRITGGAKANSMGQLAQKFVKEYVRDNCGIKGIEVRGGTVPGVAHADPATGRLTSFDIVVTNNVRYAAIEVSFQVTTNSVIERKGGQARARYEQIQQAGHRIAYVIDGAGNFQRDAALRTICEYSDCTVAFSRSELGVLCQFLREYFA